MFMAGRKVIGIKMRFNERMIAICIRARHNLVHWRRPLQSYGGTESNGRGGLQLIATIDFKLLEETTALPPRGEGTMDANVSLRWSERGGNWSFLSW